MNAQGTVTGQELEQQRYHFSKSQPGAPQPGSFRVLRINDSVDTVTKEGNSLEQQAGK